ncbi:uncharacterized protein LY89DRAFT_774610 [Mollisia scopiformis]|uniref:Uncharacterized protein n=1 Tax=Mollisia scopiformis TaxID=149040 RepID=A0A194XFW7_MOLSC|nr:uncharacterized protein LY89DRAFT_774610 [Mollisia scopiformis]KUJ18667.1 hypothetical protein LY89DRAFT_774610 [Mollisia scopiformis]
MADSHNGISEHIDERGPTYYPGQFLKQSERFDRLDAANKELVTSLVNHAASDDRGLQAQISALSTLLDRAEVVIATQEDANKRIIVDVFQRFADSSSVEESNPLLAQVRTADQEIQNLIPTETLGSLRFQSMSERFEAVDESHATTFDWIFRPFQNTVQYAEGRRWGDFGAWLESGTGLYWINGKAGSGKSTLMKYIVNHNKTSSLLRRWAENLKLCTSAFFFWNSGSKQQCSQAGLFRSLLYEILGQHPELIPTVLPAQWGARYSAKCQARQCPLESWQLSTLKMAFKTLIAQKTVPLKLCLFIDGLDEYEGDDEEIADLFGKASMSDNVKICCSSRPHQAFEDTFVTRPGLRLQDLTIPDMRKYVHDRLEKNARMQHLSEEEPEATKELIEEIGTAASGVFLWVRLVVSSLLSGLGKHDDISYLQMRLRELPPELDDLYEHMVFKVDKVYQKETAQLFQLIGTAFRDQTDDFFSWRETKQLSVLLLSFASERDATLALEAKSGFMTKEKITTRCKNMEIHLRTRCGGLLEIQYGNEDPYTTTVSPDMTVAYIHRTIKDYLELWGTREKLADRSGSQQNNP